MVVADFGPVVVAAFLTDSDLIGGDFGEEFGHLSLRALVSETPSAEFEYRESKKHADVIVRHHGQLVAEIADLERRMNDLLDRMKEHSS